MADMEIVIVFIKNEWGWTVKYDGNSLTKAPYSSKSKALSGKWRQLIPDCPEFEVIIRCREDECGNRI